MNDSTSLYVTFPAGTPENLIQFTCAEILNWDDPSPALVTLVSIESQDDQTLVAHAVCDKIIWASASERAIYLTRVELIKGWQLL